MTLKSKKYLVATLIMFTPVCFVIVKRKELYESAGQFGDPSVDLRAWLIAGRGNETHIDLNVTEYASGNFSKSEEDLFVDLEQIQRSPNNIFFIESKCATGKLASAHSGGDFILSPRQCCAVESTSRTNLDRQVYIMHSCPLTEGFLERSPLYSRLLLNRRNVHLVRFNASEVFSGTPVEELVNRKGLENSSFPVEHTSDVLRLVMLWRFGGVYCDTDVVTLRSFEALGNNFCGLESSSTINNAVLAVEPSGFGHDLLTSALKHINDHFVGTQWSANGPILLTQTIVHACNITINEISKCERFSVFNSSVLYPVAWWDAGQLFDAAAGPSLVSSIAKTSYLVHLWNRVSIKSVVQVGSSQAYGILADHFCPDVYRNCGDTF